MSWHWQRDWGRAHVECWPSGLTRPRIVWEFADAREGYLSLELGDGSSDPVIALYLDPVTPPAWITWLLRRWGDCRECGCWLGLTRSQSHAWDCSRSNLSEARNAECRRAMERQGS